MQEVSCDAERWTQVDSYAGIAPVTRRYTTNPPTHVVWRWFSFGVLFFWTGSFDESACITLLPSAFLNLQFNPAHDTWVIITDDPC